MLERDVFINYFANEIKNTIKEAKQYLKKGEPIILADYPEAYEKLQIELSQEQKTAVINILYERLVSITHSVMVMFDNGTYLSDTFLIDIINSETNESLIDSVDASLHEDFIDIMYRD